jgi:hypothetical protein
MNDAPDRRSEWQQNTVQTFSYEAMDSQQQYLTLETLKPLEIQNL